MLLEAYGDYTPSISICKLILTLQKSDFDTEDEEHPGQPKKFKDEEVKALFEQNSS